MSEYETVTIFNPDLPASKIDRVRERVQRIVQDHKGRLLLEKDWGNRKLAYRVGRFHFGRYHFFHYDGDGSFVTEIERMLKLEEGILRFLTVRVEIDPTRSEATKSRRISDPEEGRFGFDEMGARGGGGGFQRRETSESAGGHHAQET